MAGLRGKVLLALLVLLGTSSSAQAWWWGWRGWGYGYYGPAYYGPAYYSAAYYAPAYYAYYPSYPTCSSVVPPAEPQSVAPAKKVAETVPSGTSKEPPGLGNMMKKGPTVTESRSQGGVYAGGANSKDRCKVGFWNLTGRDVTLKVDGQQRLLPRDRAVTLELERAFVWQLDQGDRVTERVPDDQPFHEVILRQ